MGNSGISEVRERLETERLIVRRHRTLRIPLVLLVSALLLLFAAIFWRDHVRRESALADIRVLGEAFADYVRAYGTFPTSLTVVTDKISDVDAKFEYADMDRRVLATMHNQIVVIVFARQPTRLILRRSGRGVLLCRRADFQVKWLTEEEFAAHRRREAGLIAKLREAPHVGGKPDTPPFRY